MHLRRRRVTQSIPPLSLSLSLFLPVSLCLYLSSVWLIHLSNPFLLPRRPRLLLYPLCSYCGGCAIADETIVPPPYGPTEENGYALTLCGGDDLPPPPNPDDCAAEDCEWEDVKITIVSDVVNVTVSDEDGDKVDVQDADPPIVIVFQINLPELAVSYYPSFSLSFSLSLSVLSVSSVCL